MSLKNIRGYPILKYSSLVVLAFLVNLPIISMINTALKSEEAALASPTFFPRSIDFNSFFYVWQQTNFSRHVLNSLLVSVFVTLGCVVIASLAGYALSRFQGGFMDLYSVMLLLIQMFPWVLLLIPLFLIFRRLNLINTLASVVVAYTALALPFSIWMLKAFFDTIPFSIEESAMIDGCNQFQSFMRIIIPLSLPGISAVAIFTFIFSWKEYLLASVFLRSSETKTITVGLQQFVSQFTTDWSSLMTASTIATVPILILILVAQKYLVAGLTAGATKG